MGTSKSSELLKVALLRLGLRWPIKSILMVNNHSKAPSPSLIPLYIKAFRKNVILAQKDIAKIHVFVHYPPVVSNRWLLVSKAGIAQLVEHLVYTEAVGGSSPSSCTI